MMPVKIFFAISLFFLFSSVSFAEEKADSFSVENAASEVLNDFKDISIRDSIVFYKGKPFNGLIQLESLKESGVAPLERVLPLFFYRQLIAAPFKKESMQLELHNGFFRSVRVRANDDRNSYVTISLTKTGGFLRMMYQNNYLKVEQEYNKQGEPHGKFISYYPDGKKYYTGEYRNGKNFGTMCHFGKDGTLLKKVEFKDGKVVKGDEPAREKAK